MTRVLRMCLVCASGVVTPAVAAARPASLAGDSNLDWSVDAADWADATTCLLGPGVGVSDTCAAHDLDGDGDVDLADHAGFQAAFTGTQFLVYAVEADENDGTEVNAVVWHPDGYAGDGGNRMGAAAAETFDIGLRFNLAGVRAGDEFAYARLVLPATGAGNVATGATLRIVGVDQDGVAGFGDTPPSLMPKTPASVCWTLSADWPATAADFSCSPFWRYTPDLAPIINAIVSRPGWGGGPDGSTLALVLEDDGSAPGDFLVFQDYREVVEQCAGAVAARLELYRTVPATFVGKELLSRPTDQSLEVHALALVTLEAYVEFGTAPGSYDRATSIGLYPGGAPMSLALAGLTPDTRYYYRLRCRRPGDPEFAARPERSFHTQRAPGAAFTYAVQSDSHLHTYERDPQRCALYRAALNNIHRDAPDFLVDIGDTFNSESYNDRNEPSRTPHVMDDVLDLEEGIQRHLAQRPFFDLVCHSAPFYFAIGNHEGEQGWRLNNGPDNVAVWATNARKLVCPLPIPNSFYSGNAEKSAFTGMRENYYAWEWGEALFVVLDPYWYTVRKPHSHGGSTGSNDNWDWTLGAGQYAWLRETLEHTAATYKFVFAHQVTGGVDTYGRGGIEAARHALGGRGSFEWGGEDLDGTYAFDVRRPGWGRPIHDLLVDTGVTIFFHGHDHVFVKQELDGVIYQACPQPSDTFYGFGNYPDGLYTYGDAVANSGHLRVTVDSAAVMVEYVRAYLPDDGPNGSVAYAYSVPRPTKGGGVVVLP